MRNYDKETRDLIARLRETYLATDATIDSSIFNAIWGTTNLGQIVAKFKRPTKDNLIIQCVVEHLVMLVGLSKRLAGVQLAQVNLKALQEADQSRQEKIEATITKIEEGKLIYDPVTHKHLAIYSKERIEISITATNTTDLLAEVTEIQNKYPDCPVYLDVSVISVDIKLTQEQLNIELLRSFKRELEELMQHKKILEDRAAQQVENTKSFEKMFDEHVLSIKELL
jgi:hypothetical protein